MLTHTAGVSLGNQSNGNARPAYVPPYLRARKAAETTAPAPTKQFNGAAPTPTQAGNGYRPSPTGLPTPAPTPVPQGSYVPPSARGGAPAGDRADGGWGGPAPRGPPGGGRFDRSLPPGVGAWRDGKHILGSHNPRLERELYGEDGDGTHQVSGK